MPKKSIKEEELKLFLSQTHSSNQYDIDLLLAYKQIQKITNNDGIDLAKKEEIFKLIESHIKIYCQLNNLNFDLHFKYNRAIVINEAHPNYDFELAILLIGFDVNR